MQLNRNKNVLFICFNIGLYLSLSLQPTHLANFNQVQSIQYSALEEKDRKGMLQLNVAGAPEVRKHSNTHLTYYSTARWSFRKYVSSKSAKALDSLRVFSDAY